MITPPDPISLFLMAIPLTILYEISIGVSWLATKTEEEKIVSFFEETQQANRLVLYACTSAYPVPFEDICMLEIVRIKEKFQNRVKSIGFSGHHLGIAVDVAAYTLGAEWIERHFTLDRNMYGTDQSASITPPTLKELIGGIRKIELALQGNKDKIKLEILIVRNLLQYTKKSKS